MVLNFKIVLLGEGCVGKTSVVQRYCQNQFNDKHVTTLQASFLTKRLNLDSKQVQLSIWDTAGQERFHALGPIYYRDAHGALLVYDITDRDSFNRAKNWVKELRKMLGNEVVLVIIGNKIDLEKNRVIPQDEAEQFAEQSNAKHFYTSAKLNRGLEEVFVQLTRDLINKHNTNNVSVSDQNTPALKSRKGLTIANEEEAVQSTTTTTCC
eukprot:TRINITY_DN18_c1_g1_i1.p1 TRINITY_DN18_c1_g1~~TRINITY_DN18_c1_g1_i1.p1  ORF type:complete len:209 (+),score=98.40 TRINITY_DN18_c1_g1_i1:98-724(+)